jgi:hypothetical protein
VMAEATFQVKARLTLAVPSLTMTIGANTPVLAAPAAMVPEMTPVEALRLRPGGRPAAL